MVAVILLVCINYVKSCGIAALSLHFLVYLIFASVLSRPCPVPDVFFDSCSNVGINLICIASHLRCLWDKNSIDGIDDLSFFVAMRIFSIHLQFLARRFMGVEFYLPSFLSPGLIG